jgi:hypothetical protein
LAAGIFLSGTVTRLINEEVMIYNQYRRVLEEGGNEL